MGSLKSVQDIVSMTFNKQFGRGIPLNILEDQIFSLKRSYKRDCAFILNRIIPSEIG